MIQQSLERGKRRLVDALSRWRNPAPPPPPSTTAAEAASAIATILSEGGAAATLRGDEAAPAPFHRYTTLCRRMNSQRTGGLAVDIAELSAPCSPSVRHRCYREKPQPSDTRLRSILKTSACPCKTGRSPDSAYDSSSNCSWEGSDRHDSISEDEEEPWSDEEGEESEVSAAVLMQLAEFEPLAVPFAQERLQVDRVRRINAQWEAMYSRNLEIHRPSCESCSCTAKKSVRHRDSSPQVFTFIKIF